MGIFNRKKEKTPVKLKDLFLQYDKKDFVENMHNLLETEMIESFINDFICSVDGSKSPIADKDYLDNLYDDIIALARKDFDESLTEGYKITDSGFFSLDFLKVLKEKPHALEDVTEVFLIVWIGSTQNIPLNFCLTVRLTEGLSKRICLVRLLLPPPR